MRNLTIGILRRRDYEVTTPRSRPAPTFHPVTVADISQLTPRMRRITFSGEKLAEYPNDGPATHVKLLLPAPGQAEVSLPTCGPDGLRWPDPRPVRRTFTPRPVDRAGQRLVVDFALHSDGRPASATASWSPVRAGPTGSTRAPTGHCWWPTRPHCPRWARSWTRRQPAPGCCSSPRWLTKPSSWCSTRPRS